MGKSETKSLKRSKQTKSPSKYNSDKSTPTLEVEENQTIRDEDIQIEQEEEVICDGEVSMGSNEDVTDCIDVEMPDAELDSSNSTPTKLQQNSSKSKSKRPKTNVIQIPSSVSSIVSSTNPANPANRKSKRRRDSSTSSEEERWLTAIEAGKLEDVDDELKKIKNPKLMTARQRAMYERNLDREPTLPGGEILMSLPIGYREREKPQTAEEIQKAALKSQRRKQQADEKREKDKKKTMDRLLKKQESKQRSTLKTKSTKFTTPMFRYINNSNGAYINLPENFEFPLKAQKAKEPPKIQLCGIKGCAQPKVYNCSKTNVPLCSFECYKKNVQSAKNIMC